MSQRHISRITAFVVQSAAKDVLDALSKAGVKNLLVAQGRSNALEEKKMLFGLSKGVSLADDPVSVLQILTSPAWERKVLDLVINSANLSVPGRGMAWSENMDWVEGHPACAENASAEGGEPSGEDSLMGICCIVQRGQGPGIAKAALELGHCAPGVTYGVGTGLRDKVGLLRVTIPADKEVITLACSRPDAEDVMDKLIDAGHLDQPGKGFIYIFPIHNGVLNMGISRGLGAHGASMDQIVATLDELKGGTEWRRHTYVADQGPKRNYLTGLKELLLVCDEGKGQDLVTAAMAVGAAGATISNLKYHSFEKDEKGPAKARETCSMIVGDAQIPTLMEALKNAGAFGDEAHGLVLSRPAPKACTYLPPKKG